MTGARDLQKQCIDKLVAKLQNSEHEFTITKVEDSIDFGECETFKVELHNEGGYQVMISAFEHRKGVGFYLQAHNGTEIDHSIKTLREVNQLTPLELASWMLQSVFA